MSYPSSTSSDPHPLLQRPPCINYSMYVYWKFNMYTGLNWTRARMRWYHLNNGVLSRTATVYIYMCVCIYALWVVRVFVNNATSRDCGVGVVGWWWHGTGARRTGSNAAIVQSPAWETSGVKGANFGKQCTVPLHPLHRNTRVTCPATHTDWQPDSSYYNMNVANFKWQHDILREVIGRGII